MHDIDTLYTLKYTTYKYTITRRRDCKMYGRKEEMRHLMELYNSETF